jgi:hypothetical protein
MSTEKQTFNCFKDLNLIKNQDQQPVDNNIGESDYLQQVTFDLNKFIDKSIRVMVGFLSGQDMADTLQIERILNSGKKVNIIIPNEIYSLNATYLTGLLSKAFSMLGREGIEKHVSFSGKFPYQQPLSEALRLLSNQSQRVS